MLAADTEDMVPDTALDMPVVDMVPDTALDMDIPAADTVDMVPDTVPDMVPDMPVVAMEDMALDTDIPAVDTEDMVIKSKIIFLRFSWSPLSCYLLNKWIYMIPCSL